MVKMKSIQNVIGKNWIVWMAGLSGSVGIAAACLLSGCVSNERSAENVIGEEWMASGEAADSDAVISSVADPTKPPELCIFVCGAVQNPGVVFLPEDGRCVDALEAAGGFTEDAATDAVNLAEPVTDGMKLYFPTKEEQELLKLEQAALEEEQRAAEAGLVNINTADVEQICTLPGIGKVKAEAIVAYREQYGAFATKEDIMKVPGIKENAYSKIKDLLLVK